MSERVVWAPLRPRTDAGLQSKTWRLLLDRDSIEELSKGRSARYTRDNQGCTALHKAAAKGKQDTVKVLIDQKADIEARNKTGCTPLHEACNNGYILAARDLIEAGADVNAKNNDNNTPLHVAAAKNLYNIV